MRGNKKPGFATRAIHVGQEPEPVTGAVSPPIHQTSTFRQKDFAEYDFDYSRADNPTRRNLESTITSLEEGLGAVAFGSGMAAEAAIFSLLSQGDHVIFSRNVYGGTFRLFDKIFNRFGLSASWINTSSIGSIEKAITSRTRLIFIETPSNPLMQISDIRAVAGLASSRDILLAVDNTFLSPYFQRPLTLGAHLVTHSSTKYLNGHSDVVGGIVITSDQPLLEKLRFIQMSGGAIPGPFDCWLTQRSLKTLELRMKVHNSNALSIAEFLSSNGKFEKIFYPGLKNHPQYKLAAEQQLDPLGRPGFGGMISAELASLDNARKFVKGLKIFTLAESLGGVESLVCHPATMTHASIPEEKRDELGISAGLVRLSIGVENVDDLIEDLQRSIGKI
ncbi:MAG: PLP-dependent transferase [FCB group bacterium]|nr:PLP-dependent transferase [FCB group bacterium]